MKGEKDEKPPQSVGEITIPQDGDRLESWKEIAAFLKRTERTVMRYEELGMPVHRMRGTKRSRVMASRSELTKWFAEKPSEETQAVQEPLPVPKISEPTISKRRYASVGLGIAVLAAALAAIVFRPSNSSHFLADAKLKGETLTALDSDGHTLWTHTFQRKLNTNIVGPPTYFTTVADLLGDGEREVIAIVPYALGPNLTDGTACEVTCFSSRGKVLWSYLPRETFRFGTHELHGPWQVLEPIVSRRGTKKAIYVALIHDTWGNSFIVELDPRTGHDTVRFVNTGTIRSLGEVQTEHATYLIAGGFNNEWDGGSAAFVDEDKPFAASPQTEGTRFKCTSCATGVPDYYLVFPRSEGNRIRKRYENPIKGVKANGNEVLFVKYEEVDGDVDGIYLLSLEPLIHPISVRYGSSYDLEHGELERTGALRHTLAQCPERLHPPPVRVWTPAGGWAELNFGPSGFDQ